MAIFACIWNAIGIDLGWLFLTMGLLIGGAVFPAAFAITWAGQSTAGAISGCLVGLIAGLTAWLVTAYQYFGEITIASTGEEYSTLAGNLAAILTGLIVTVVVSLIKPQNFDWAITRAINARPLDGVAADRSQSAQEESSEGKLATDTPTAIDDGEKEKSDAGTATPPDDEYVTEDDEDLERAADRATEENPASLRRAFFTACIAAFVLTAIMDFLVSSISLCFLHCTADILRVGAHSYVSLALHFQQGRIHDLGHNQFPMGLCFHGNQRHSSDRRDTPILQEICARCARRWKSWEKALNRMTISF